MRRTAPVAAATLAAAAVLAPTAAHADTPWDVTNHSTSSPAATPTGGAGWTVTVTTGNGARTPDAMPPASPTTPSERTSSGFCWPVDCATEAQQVADAGAALGAAAASSTATTPTTHRATPRRTHRAAASPRRHHAPHATTLTSRWLVGPGDTLSLVSAVWGVSVERIAAHNGIADPDMITVGQVLHRPAGGTR